MIAVITNIGIAQTSSDTICIARSQKKRFGPFRKLPSRHSRHDAARVMILRRFSATQGGPASPRPQEPEGPLSKATKADSPIRRKEVPWIPPEVVKPKASVRPTKTDSPTGRKEKLLSLAVPWSPRKATDPKASVSTSRGSNWHKLI